MKGDECVFCKTETMTKEPDKSNTVHFRVITEGVQTACCPLHYRAVVLIVDRILNSRLGKLKPSTGHLVHFHQNSSCTCDDIQEQDPTDSSRFADITGTNDDGNWENQCPCGLNNKGHQHCKICGGITATW